MTLLTLSLFALVEGLTEFLPVSSTAHLLLLSHILGIAQSTEHVAFEIAIQCGAIAAALVLERRFLCSFRILSLTAIAFVPTAILGFLLHDVVTTYFFATLWLVLASLGIGGVILLIFSAAEHRLPVRVTSIEDISVRQALLIGTAQALALIPGISRSAATIVSGQCAGISRKTIVEFSFLLAVPTMAAATGLDMIKSAEALSAAGVQSILIGCGLSFVVAYASMRWFLQYVQSHSLFVFGVYRVLVAIIFGFLFLR